MLPKRVDRPFRTITRNTPVNFNVTGDGRRVAVLVGTKELEHVVTHFADQYLNEDFAHCDVAVVYLLNATTRLLCAIAHDLTSPASIIEVPLQVESVGGRNSEVVRPNLAMLRPHELRGRDVLLVDVQVNSGATLAAAYDAVATCDPATLTTACLLRKYNARRIIEPDHTLFEVSSDADPIGFGLDFAGTGKYRGLLYVADARVENYPRQMKSG